EAQYFRRKQQMYEAVMAFLSKRTTMEKIIFDLNTLDEPGRGVGGIYLAGRGTSAESGDSGQLGGGNMVNDVIPSNCPRGPELAGIQVFCRDLAAGKYSVC